MTTATPIKLYELAGADENRRFSPYCWRIRLALRHKGLDFVGIPWRFTDKAAIAFSGQGKVPVIVDRDQVVSDSWAIAQYLDMTYPEQPSLLGGLQGQALSRFITDWAETVLQAELVRLIAIDVYAHLDESDKVYFRQTREQFFGITLEALCGDRDQRLAGFRSYLKPLRVTLQRQPFLAGQTPAWADYAVFAAFQWARCISPLPLLAADDGVLLGWRDRLLDAFDGEARNALGYPG